MSSQQSPRTYWAVAAEERMEAARFFAEHISPDASYISHGEIQTGLSIDGETWASDLEKRFLEDLETLGEGQQLAVMRDSFGVMIATAIVQWEETSRVKFGVLEDLAVQPSLRSSGLGHEMVTWIDGQAKQRGCRWMFLESGKKNHRAHAFFERCGFAEISHVFVKQYR